MIGNGLELPRVSDPFPGIVLQIYGFVDGEEEVEAGAAVEELAAELAGAYVVHVEVGELVAEVKVGYARVYLNVNDVRKIDQTYNRNYLRAEYNFCQASANMAAKWEQFQEDGDRYNLQYRTVRDGRVRPEHAALHGITLPPSDPFWQSYFPPNGWNCRCTVI